MKFYGTIHHHLKIEKSEAYENYGLISANETVCKKTPSELGVYLMGLVASAANFACDCGLSTEEGNAALDYLRVRLTEVRITEREAQS